MQYHPFLHALYESIGRLNQQLMSAVMEVDYVLLPGFESPHALICTPTYLRSSALVSPPTQAPS